VEVTVTAHHEGHFEFAVRPVAFDEAPSFECFQSNRLEFVADELHGAPKDENCPERAVIPPSNFPANIPSTGGAIGGVMCRFCMKLPDNVRGNFVLLQWRCISANTCAPVCDNICILSFDFSRVTDGSKHGSLGHCKPVLV
jgi:hypothetical protein